MRITTHINRGKVLSDSSHPIRIAIHRGDERQVLYLHGQSIHSNNWNASTGRAYTTKRENTKHKSVSDNAAAVNAAISDAINKAEAICKLNPEKDLPKIKDLIKDAIRPEEKVKVFAKADESFNEYLLNNASDFDKVGRFGYSARFTVVAKKFREYLDKPDFRFTDINKSTLQGFVNWMMKKNGSATARGSIKIMKTAYFSAQEDNKAPEGNPFKGLKYAEKAGVRTTRLKWLTLAHIETIMGLELSGFRALTRDVFCFQFYANGDRVRDAIQLHRSDIDKDGYYHFKQTKTREEKRVKLPPPALKILSKYPDKGHIFFPELDGIKDSKTKYDRCSAITTQINSDLKVIGQLADIPFPVTSHCARHSFAAHIYLKTKDIQLTSKALGHSSISQTAVYLKALGVMELADTIASIWE